MRKGMLLLFILGFAGSLLGMQSSQSASGNGNPAAELLMKGMQAEDLSGNLGEAVRYYSQAVNTPTDQRVYAAYAQLRLAQISLERGISQVPCSNSRFSSGTTRITPILWL